MTGDRECCENSNDAEDKGGMDFECKRCNLSFSTEAALKMHNNLHGITFKCLTESEIALRRDLLYEEVIKQQEKDEERTKAAKIVHKPRRVYKPKSTRVGLTKIKMEECLRCDACSCIYIDPQDYYKHMRNFHQKFNTVIPRTRRKTGQQIIRSPELFVPKHDVNEEKMENESQASFKLENPNMREHIKNRWSQVVLERLKLPELPVKIKEEPPDEDYSYLLGNVEVRIKSEPMDS